MSHSAADGPGALVTKPGTIHLNQRANACETFSIVIENAGDRPVQIGSHFHLPDVNDALIFDRDVTRGYRLDIPSGTSVRFEPGVSRTVDVVSIQGNRIIQGLRLGGPTRLGD